MMEIARSYRAPSLTKKMQRELYPLSYACSQAPTIEREGRWSGGRWFWNVAGETFTACDDTGMVVLNNRYRPW